jgi:MerR family copper efflux transcriptional regulator
MTKKTGMTRGQLAKITGVSMATIRYYEESGVLPIPRRQDNGYRIYSEDYLVKLQLIIDAKSLGYSLKEIQEVLHVLGHEMEPETLRSIVRDKIAEIDDRISSLRNIQSMLSSLLQTPKEEIHTYLRSFRGEDEHK